MTPTNDNDLLNTPGAGSVLAALLAVCRPVYWISSMAALAAMLVLLTHPLPLCVASSLGIAVLTGVAVQYFGLRLLLDEHLFATYYRHFGDQPGAFDALLALAGLRATPAANTLPRPLHDRWLGTRRLWRHFLASAAITLIAVATAALLQLGLLWQAAS